MLLKIFWFIIWVLMILFVIQRAGQQGRNKLLWGIFALFLPVIALIVILIIKPKNE